jgi:hypothetical protein
MASKKKPDDKADKPKAKIGRPTVYTKELGEKICDVIKTTNLGLRKICENPEFPPHGTVVCWLENTEHPFTLQYTRAKEGQADYLADEMMEIADDCKPEKFHVEKAKLQVDTRKWIASKLKVKKYGDKLINEHTGTNGQAIKIASQELDLSGLSDEELILFKSLSAKITPKKDDNEK